MTIADNDRLQAGDVKIHGAVVVNRYNRGIDVKNLLVELKIYENMSSPFITGTLMISDATALSTSLPFVGQEMLILEIETPTPDLSQEFSGLDKRLRRIVAFHIYKMSGQANVAMKSKFYSLHFVSLEGFKDMNVALSSTYRGKISDVVRTILTSNKGLETEKSLAIEDTNNSVVYTSNFWNPSRNMYYLAGRAINSINSPSYFFFENNEGFVFASLEAMYSTPILQEFIRDPKTRVGNNVPNIDEEYKRVLDMSSSDTVFDYIEQKELGAFGSTIYEVSFDRKALRKNIIANGDNPFATTPSDPKNLALVADPTSNIMEQYIHRTLHNGYKNLSPTHGSKRALLLKNLQNITTNVQVFGRLDYTVGRMVNLTVYKDQTVDEKTEDSKLEDELLSGNYIISSLCHIITRNNHICNMELSKATFKKETTEGSQQQAQTVN